MYSACVSVPACTRYRHWHDRRLFSVRRDTRRGKTIWQFRDFEHESTEHHSSLQKGDLKSFRPPARPKVYFPNPAGPKPTQQWLARLCSCWVRELIWGSVSADLKSFGSSARPGIYFQTQPDQSRPSHCWVGFGAVGFGSFFAVLLEWT